MAGPSEAGTRAPAKFRAEAKFVCKLGKRVLFGLAEVPDEVPEACRALQTGGSQQDVEADPAAEQGDEPRRTEPSRVEG
jgi:hypothetical protein